MPKYLSRLAAAAFVTLAGFSSGASAYVQCGPLAINRYYIGDRGWFWIHWENGGAAAIDQSNPDFKYIVSTTMLAVATNRKLIVRYADGVSCMAPRAEPLGIYLFQ